MPVGDMGRTAGQRSWGLGARDCLPVMRAPEGTTGLVKSQGAKSMRWLRRENGKTGTVRVVGRRDLSACGEVRLSCRILRRLDSKRATVTPRRRAAQRATGNLLPARTRQQVARRQVIARHGPQTLILTVSGRAPPEDRSARLRILRLLPSHTPQPGLPPARGYPVAGGALGHPSHCRRGDAPSLEHGAHEDGDPHHSLARVK